jgi:DNA-binding NarL/FixJ family response regulator
MSVPHIEVSRNGSRGRNCHSADMSFRCLIVDDSAVFVRAARSLLEREGVAVVGVASTGAEALRQSAELHPEVTLLDIDLGGESGLDLARRLTEDGHSSSRMILISTHAEADFADLIAESPVAGFLSKSNLSAEAIRHLLSNDRDLG